MDEGIYLIKIGILLPEIDFCHFLSDLSSFWGNSKGQVEVHGLDIGAKTKLPAVHVLGNRLLCRCNCGADGARHKLLVAGWLITTGSSQGASNQREVA